MKFVIYGKSNCPYCDKAKALAQREGHNFVYKQLDVDFTAEEMKELFPTARTFPQIIFDDQKIGGYQEMEAVVEDIKKNLESLS